MKHRHFVPSNWNGATVIIKAVAVILGIYLIVNNNISVQFNINNSITEDYQPQQSIQQFVSNEQSRTAVPKVMTVSQPLEQSTVGEGISDNLANTYSNLDYTDTRFATKETTTTLKTKREKQIAYVKRFAKVARAEMEKYGIPASITLAQGLIESNCGESRLATRNNNHFGIKCFSRKCKRGHCTNYEDDTHKDFFRNFGSAWESYRGHSILLKKDRYQSLYKLSKTDYKAWAHGLKKAGYATDPNYAYKLIEIIETLQLHKLDKTNGK